MPYIPAKKLAFLVLTVLASFLSGCGGGGGYSSSSPAASTTTYKVGGTASGLAGGTNVVLVNNSSDTVTVSADGTFFFPTQLNAGAMFSVAISSNPSGEICSIGGPIGIVSQVAVTALTVACNATTATVSTFAGHTGTSGSVDGSGTAAYFKFPIDVAVDSAGNAYVTDMGNRTIRKITPGGAVTTLAGSPGVIGSANGNGASASFGLPSGIAVDAAGNVYVADAGNQTIRKITPGGAVTNVAGHTGVPGSADGTGAAASFYNPAGLTIDASGNIFVVDSGNDTIRKITPAGVVTTFAGTAGVTGLTDGTGAAATFYAPIGIALDSSGNLYVSDGLNTIRKITSAAVVTTFAGKAGVIGAADGSGAVASFNGVGALGIDSSDNLYVADQGNATIRKITPAGAVTTVAGTVGKYGAADGNAGAATFGAPSGVAVDSSGNLYVTDYGNHTVRKITP